PDEAAQLLVLALQVPLDSEVLDREAGDAADRADVLEVGAVELLALPSRVGVEEPEEPISVHDGHADEGADLEVDDARPEVAPVGHVAHQNRVPVALDVLADRFGPLERLRLAALHWGPDPHDVERVGVILLALDGESQEPALGPDLLGRG